jgi:hypothetical protein
MRIAFLQKRKPASGLRKLYIKYLVRTSRKKTISNMYSAGMTTVTGFMADTGKKIQLQRKRFRKSSFVKQISNGKFITVRSRAISKWYNKKAVPAIVKADKQLSAIEKQVTTKLASIGKAINYPGMKKSFMKSYNNLNKNINKTGPQVVAFFNTQIDKAREFALS